MDASQDALTDQELGELVRGAEDPNGLLCVACDQGPDAGMRVAGQVVKREGKPRLLRAYIHSECWERAGRPGAEAVIGRAESKQAAGAKHG